MINHIDHYDLQTGQWYRDVSPQIDKSWLKDFIPFPVSTISSTALGFRRLILN
jgi:hypothetical protein